MEGWKSKELKQDKTGGRRWGRRRKKAGREGKEGGDGMRKNGKEPPDDAVDGGVRLPCIPARQSPICQANDTIVFQ